MNSHCIVHFLVVCYTLVTVCPHDIQGCYKPVTLLL